MVRVADTNFGNPKKLGIVVDDFCRLAGAVDFIVSFVDGTVRAAGDRQAVLIFRTPPKPKSIWTALRWLRYTIRQEKVCCEDQIQRLYAAGLAKLPLHVIERSELEIEKLCHRENIDVIGPLCTPPRGSFGIPWIGYLGDFQHRYLPQLFSRKIIRSRDKAFHRMLTKANSVVVNAKEVKSDVGRFFPSFTDRVFALTFSAAPKEEWFSTDPDRVLEKYGIGQRYFLVSNQFWLHKRHEIVIEAFARVACNDDQVELVLTGATNDWRAPTRLKDLRALIASLGITSRIHILGIVPKLDQIAIMREAVAVVQPTSFEGGPGGGSVFDAVALGVPTIVSDIPVNREIEAYVRDFFPLDDIKSLANSMSLALCNERVVSNPRQLLTSGKARRTLMGKDIWEAAVAALNNALGAGSRND